MIRTDRHLRVSVFAVGLALTAGVAAAYLLGGFDQAEAGLYDFRAQHFQRFSPRPTDRIVHVDIDDATLEAVGAWPWPRTLMAEMVDEMSAAGAKAIALDVIYTEPQKPEWEPVGPPPVTPMSPITPTAATRPDTTRPAATQPTPAGPAPAELPAPAVVGAFRAVDHDANLAAAFRRAGNLFLPASLQFVPAHAQTPATAAALDLLTRDLERSPADLATTLEAQGFGAGDVLAVGSIYFDLRREAAQARAERELDRIEAAAATRPGTRPADADEAAVRLALAKALFPNRDPSVSSPEARLVDDAYEHVVAGRLLARLGRAPIGDAAPVYRARNQILPLSGLLGSAAATGYVDYPNLGEGTVRNVPLLMEHRGRVFAQIGFRMALQLLEVDPADLRVTPAGITIPAGTLSDGTPRAERTIPVRTIRRTVTSGRTIEFPLVMDIPWVGGRQWYSMYDDPSGPARAGGGGGRSGRKTQHLPLAVLYDAVRTRQKLARSAAEADRAARNLLDIAAAFLPEVAAAAGEYPKRAIAGVDPAADAATAAWVLKQVEPSGLVPGLPLDDPKSSEKERLAIRAANALAELPKLSAQLGQQRAQLRQILGGRAAIVGWTATAAVADQKPTPLHAAAPGVVIHGAIASGILTGDLWRAAPAWVTVVTVLLLGALTTAAVARLAPVSSLVTAVGLTVAYAAVNCWLLFDYGNLIVDLGAPLLAVGVPWAGGTMTRLIIEARERARITRRFSTYVDPDIVNYFLEVRDETMFSGQRRDTAIVFTDLEGFTTLSERLGEDIVPLLNDFMGRAVRVIKQHRGLVNKFLGDGILFFFNAPKPNATYVTDAIDAILDLQVMMVGFNKELADEKLPRLRLRAGVTAGPAITGDAGTSERADYTVIGNLVNLAARLESANKSFGTSNLVTEDAVRAAGDRFLFRPIGVVQVVGLHTGVMVYETVAWAKDATERDRALVDQTRAMVNAFTAGQAVDCVAAAERLEAEFGQSKLTKAYRELAGPFAAGEAEGEMPRQIVLDAK